MTKKEVKIPFLARVLPYNRGNSYKVTVPKQYIDNGILESRKKYKFEILIKQEE